MSVERGGSPASDFLYVGSPSSPSSKVRHALYSKRPCTISVSLRLQRIKKLSYHCQPLPHTYGTGRCDSWLTRPSYLSHRCDVLHFAASVAREHGVEA